VTVPVEYHGRESTYLKHRVLANYLQQWAHKLGSRARYGPTRLWYVDCFAGPWRAADQELRDTSVFLGLEALRAAAETWSAKGHQVELGAIFVEKNDRSYEALEEFVSQNAGAIKATSIHGEFGGSVGDINRLVGRDPAFLFVDPTGWKGAAMKYIAPLAEVDGRDVLINVMFNDINRFKEDPRAFLRKQMREFFGLTNRDIPPGLDEDSLFDFYRAQLRDKCHLPLVADLAIPHPTKQRTWFRLAVGGHHRAIVELFRQVEHKVCGGEASEVRAEAKQRGEAQLGLFRGTSEPDQSYQRLHHDGLAAAAKDVRDTLLGRSPRLYADLWPEILANRHILKSDLNKVVWNMHKANELTIQGIGPRERSPKDEHTIALRAAEKPGPGP
jgi:three-Cys-motif partner protein